MTGFDAGFSVSGFWRLFLCVISTKITKLIMKLNKAYHFYNSVVGIQGAGINSKIEIKVKYPLTWCRYTGTVNKKTLFYRFLWLILCKFRKCSRWSTENVQIYLLSKKSNYDFVLDFRMKAAPRIFIKLIRISGEYLFRALICLNKNSTMGRGI